VATANAAAPQFTPVPVRCELRLFLPVTSDDVVAVVRALPEKQCSSDPQPTRLLKAHVDILSPLLSHLFSWSLQHGVVPANIRSAYVTPIVKKAGMDPVDVKSYRLISNLSVLSKLLECFVSKQLVKYLTFLATFFLIVNLRTVQNISFY